MSSIIANPFRVLGLIANSSEREIQKQVATLSAFARVGKSVNSKYDFASLPLVVRTEDSIRSAVTQIERPSDRLLHSLFWFVEVNRIDGMALDYLRQNDAGKAFEIWTLAITNKVISAKNFSAALNLSTLLMIRSFGDYDTEDDDLERSIRLKGMVLTNCFSEVISVVNGKAGSVDRNEVLRMFADEVLNSNDSLRLDSARLASSFCAFPEETYTYVSSRISERPFSRIENLINESASAREDEPEIANEIGLTLAKKTRRDLQLLEKILEKDNVRLQRLIDLLANELLECSIDYFNEWVESETIDPGPDSLKLLNLARSLMPQGITCQRIDENAPVIESWVAERARHEANKPDIEFIFNKLNTLSVGTASAKRALKFVSECKPKLATIRARLGGDDESYLKLSEIVASTALGMTIVSINTAQDSDRRFDGSTVLETLEDGVRVMNLLADMDMPAELRSRFNVNQKTINQIAVTLSLGIRNSSTRNPKSSPSSGANVSAPEFLAGSLSSESFGPISKVAAIVVVAILAVLGCGVLVSIQGPSNPANSNAIKNSSVNAARLSPTPTVDARVTATPKLDRPTTGTLITRGAGGSGYGTLRIVNGTSLDAIAKLVSTSTNKTFREIYIRAGSTTSISGVAVGTYELFFATGSDYAPSLKKFMSNASYSKFDSQFQYREIRDSTGVLYDTFEVSLNKVAYGSATTSSVDESTFSGK